MKVVKRVLHRSLTGGRAEMRENSGTQLIEGADRELRKSRDATHFATDGPAPRHYDGDTAAARVRVAVFVRSEKSNALVGDGVPELAPRSANLNSAFGGMQLFAPEAW